MMAAIILDLSLLVLKRGSSQQASQQGDDVGKDHQSVINSVKVKDESVADRKDGNHDNGHKSYPEISNAPVSGGLLL